MANIGLIGLASDELAWLRLVLKLLRDPDPVVGEVAREALRYLEKIAADAHQSRAAG